jgi:isoquinoline 1-oxidoreductase/isoquinoline 1-oxidoreductase beta subunit
MALKRRHFLIGGGIVGAGLILGIALPRGKAPVPGTIAGSFQPNAWLQITPDGRFVFQLHKAEMGQGVITSLPVLLAEELDVEPTRFEIEMAGVHPDFAMPGFGVQITGGSSSLSTGWESLRHAGAAARAMLVAAAAKRWGLTAAQCRTENGEVFESGGDRRIAYAELADEAGAFAETPYTLKKPAEWRWVGRDLPRFDRVAKSDGTARFGIDVELEGMKVAVIVRCPHFGGSVQQWQPGSVESLDGVVAAFAVHSGIAIVADSYWQARKAANQLQVTWEKGPLAGLDSAAIFDGLQRALDNEKPRLALERGDIDAVVAQPERTLSAQYFIPYTHHSPMEPQNATALFTERGGSRRCEVWAPNQAPDICRALAAHFGGIGHEDVIVHSTLLGGGFGRRGYPDYVGEVVAIARQLPGTPVKLIWSREDDMRHDFYRPASLHRFSSTLDEAGRIESWRHTIAVASIFRGFASYVAATVLPTWVPTTFAHALGKFGGGVMSGRDASKAEGALIPYNVAHVAVGHVEHDPGIPIGFWRSVSHSFNAFAVESFIDELAHRAGRDPLQFRLRHLPDAPRHRAVLELAAAKANWGADDRAQGIALSEPFNTPCAMVVDVAVDGDRFRVTRVVAAVDCGIVVAPQIAASQIEGGIIYGLSAALKAPVTIADGAVVESNFHDLPVLRIDEVPEIEVYFVDSDAAPTGVGEIGVPAVAPALANALFAATGQRLRELPLTLAAT